MKKHVKAIFELNLILDYEGKDLKEFGISQELIDLGFENTAKEEAWNNIADSKLKQITISDIE